MPFFKPFFIQQKMTGMIFLFSIVAMLLVSANFFTVELQRMQNLLERDIDSLAKVISSNAAQSMASNNRFAMRDILSTLKERSDIASAYLLLPDGKTTISFEEKPTSIGQSLSKRVEDLPDIERRQIKEGLHLASDVAWQESGRMSHFMPVIYRDKLVGYSYLSFEMEDFRRKKISLSFLWLLSMGIAVIATYFLSLRMHRRVIAPINELISLMQKISREKRLLGEVKFEGDNEFAMLYKGFEEMIKSLKERDKLLEKHRENLELEIQYRTRDLETEKEKAEQATIAKSRFLANMSHEIRTPMIGILGMADLLRKRSLDADDMQLVKTIYRSGESLLTILDDILDFSRVEAGKVIFKPELTDLKQLTRDVMQLMAVNAENKNLEIFSNLPSESHLVIADPGRIRQILLNLVGNAIKFTDSGSVTVTLNMIYEESRSIYECCFVVQDTGPGIDSGAHDRIFNSFEQGDGSPLSKSCGTGLGLAIVKELVDMMNGTVKIDSTPGVGSNFEVCLPLPSGDGSNSEQFESGSLALLLNDQDEKDLVELLEKTGANFHVLLAEDNPVTQHLLSIHMEQVGLELSIVNNGQAAIEFIEKHDIDLVLMDCQMPHMDGFKATEILRSKGIMVPIVALTAYARNEDQEKCLAIGMNDFLSKPFRQSEFFSILLKWLRFASHSEGSLH